MNEKNYDNPENRWAGLGPYYAMFPFSFAKSVVEKYSLKRDQVLDPFAGRGSSIFAASVLGRRGLGIEINPVGWLYGTTKLDPADEKDVLRRMNELVNESKNQKFYRDDFFRLCYSPTVYNFLEYARNNLNWKKSKVDATLLSLILVSLHGKEGSAFSNQMRQGKAMSPDYSIRWWKTKRKTPPKINLTKFLSKKIKWRYLKGKVKDTSSRMYLGDSTKLLKRLLKTATAKSSLLFTSPPYFHVTDYHYDQWLRLWMLGGPKRPQKMEGEWTKKFSSKDGYKNLLQTVFEDSARLLKKNATVYIRTDAREFTFETTRDILKDIFPKKRMTIVKRPFLAPTQTALFGDKSKKPGEMDIILSN